MSLGEHANDFYALIDRMRDGQLHLCTAATVAPQLTPDTAMEILDAVQGLSHREAERFLLRRKNIVRADSTPQPPSSRAVC